MILIATRANTSPHNSCCEMWFVKNFIDAFCICYRIIQIWALASDRLVIFVPFDWTNIRNLLTRLFFRLFHFPTFDPLALKLMVIPKCSSRLDFYGSFYFAGVKHNPSVLRLEKSMGNEFFCNCHTCHFLPFRMLHIFGKVHTTLTSRFNYERKRLKNPSICGSPFFIIEDGKKI